MPSLMFPSLDESMTKLQHSANFQRETFEMFKSFIVLDVTDLGNSNEDLLKGWGSLMFWTTSLTIYCSTVTCCSISLERRKISLC